MRFCLLLAALLLAFSASGCLGGSAGPARATTGTVVGLVVTIGGLLPPPGQSDRRVVASAPISIRGTTSAGAQLRRSLRSDRHGRFRLLLPAGRYTVTARIFENTSSEPHRRIRVRRGEQVHVRIVGYLV